MNRIEDLKKEYEAYQAPASLKRKVKNAMARAKKEQGGIRPLSASQAAAFWALLPPCLPL